MGIPFSNQQLQAITAPLAPGIIVAGAGSGKTTATAARVAWLICTGQLEPGASQPPLPSIAWGSARMTPVLHL
jgi:superfamily I DNA/RNA helicase